MRPNYHKICNLFISWRILYYGCRTRVKGLRKVEVSSSIRLPLWQPAAALKPEHQNLKPYVAYNMLSDKTR